MKKFLGITFVFILFLTIFTACSSDESSNQNDTNSESEKTTGSTDSEEPDDQNEHETIAFPEEHLQKKDEGEDVETLQTALNEIGFDLSTNGTYDEETTWAITDFQLQESLQATGVYNSETEEAAAELLSDEEQIEAGEALENEDEVDETEAGTPVNRNPYDILGLVNKEHALPDDYIPEDLVVPDVRFPFTEDLPKKELREVAADALEELFDAGDEAGVDLFAQSGYRSFDRQEAIFTANVEENGEEEANNYSARPGESEHQTGLTMDVTSPEINHELEIEFADTDEGEWVEEHAHEYGFIIRYPEEKEDITEYQYEPWHLRYVGVEAAEEITEQELSLEEYLED